MSDSKIALVTGGTKGIGKATTLGLAQAGFRVLMVGRTAPDDFPYGSGDTTFLQADLSSQADIRRLSEQIHAAVPRLDVLINNAGSVFEQRGVTVDGIEASLALNHLAPFLLTHLLLDWIPQGGRIVNVSSMAHAWAKVDFDDLQMEKQYSSVQAYARAKFMLNLTTFALARRLEGRGITANALHPGIVATKPPSGLAGRIFGLIATSPAKGAATSLFLATSPAVEGKTGGYYVKSRLASPKKESFDTNLQEKVWTISEALTHLH